jgi:two-component sensor histidine kinase
MSSFKTELIESITAQAEIIGNNSTAALAFKDQKAAEEILSAMRSAPNIKYAVIYAGDGTVFARYRRNDVKEDFSPPPPQKDIHHFTTHRLDLFRSIMLDGRQIGTIFLESDLRELYSRLKWHIVIVFVIIVASLFLSSGLSSKLHQTITKPMTKLVQIMQAISKNKDYSTRAPVYSHDEMGYLTEGFNDMLEQIQLRDAELESHRKHLEKLVGTRTAELESVNAKLNLELAERRRIEEQIKASLKEKEVLLREIHHRVKNNLQVISSLISLQGSYTKDKRMIENINETQTRIKTLALIHEKLYQSKDLARIDFAGYIKNLTNYLFRSYGVSGSITLDIKIDNVFLDIDMAIPCGLIVNELVSNSLKHAFPGMTKGNIVISLNRENENKFILAVGDNGIGFPKDIDFKNTKSLGLQLVNILADQIKGGIDLYSEVGTTFIIRFEALKDIKEMKGA